MVDAAGSGQHGFPDRVIPRRQSSRPKASAETARHVVEGLQFLANRLSNSMFLGPATEPGLARIADPDYPPVIANYANRFEDGRQVKSTSIGIKDADGNYMEVRRSAEIIAAYLGVSRATIYSDTK